MRILALITARSGSKRLPGKNTRLLGGKPLVVWTIERVLNIPEICDILISTDDIKTVDICSRFEVMVPWLRPKQLSTDAASSAAVAVHALDWYEGQNGKVDGLLLLQPTSPFRTTDTIVRGIKLYSKTTLLPVIGVSPDRVFPDWYLASESEIIEQITDGHGSKDNGVSMQTYSTNGCFYLFPPDTLRNTNSFVAQVAYPLIISSPKEALDIDTEEDWKRAEEYLQDD